MNKQHWPLLFGAAGWFCAIYWLAERNTFVSGLNKPPAAVGLAFAVPILLFLVTERILPGLRARVASISPVLLISMNGWRFIGLGFLMANAEGLLPGAFAWPAGLGDIIMALTAPGLLPRWRQMIDSALGPCFYYGTCLASPISWMQSC